MPVRPGSARAERGSPGAAARAGRYRGRRRGAYNGGVKSDELRWVENWLEAGPLLERQRESELRALTPERAMFLAEALFSMPWPEDVLARRRAGSGLLDMQDWLRRLHPR